MVNKFISLFTRTYQKLLSRVLTIPSTSIGGLIRTVSRSQTAVKLLSKLTSFNPRLYGYLERLYRDSLNGPAQSGYDPRCNADTTVAEGVNRGTRVVSEQLKEAIVSKRAVS